MKKIEEIQKRKTVSSYGGCGSIIETNENGSLLIRPYNEWRCYTGNNLLQREEIKDERLLQIVKEKFDTVERLLEIPVLDGDVDIFSPGNAVLDKCITSEFFPRWFFCEKKGCREFMKLGEWKNRWEEEFQDDNKFNENRPSCFNCSSAAGRGIHRVPLQQIRFMMASLDSGKLLDIPFDVLFNLPDQNKQGNVWYLDNVGPVNGKLSYHSRSGGDGLESLYVKCTKPDGSTSQIYLSEIEQKYLVYRGPASNQNNNQDSIRGAYRLKLRGGSDLYFPIIESSIYIPTTTKEERDNIMKLHRTGVSIDLIAQVTNKTIPQVDFIIRQTNVDANNNNQQNQPLDLKMGEFYFITNENYYQNNKITQPDFCVTRYQNLGGIDIRIQEIYALTRLKETSVLMGYKRVSPTPMRWWNIDAERELDDQPPMEHSPFSVPNPNFMPAIEAYGEGLLFVIDTEGFPENESDRIHDFLHTYSHLIIKELEFLCGYPATSLKERIYDDGTHLGFLIYAIQGSDGSYGGLTSLMPTDSYSNGKNGDAKILKVIKQAIKRAEDCPNDPICKADGAHCFACVDLPETSCEEWNNNLNRKDFLYYVHLDR